MPDARKRYALVARKQADNLLEVSEGIQSLRLTLIMTSACSTHNLGMGVATCVVKWRQSTAATMHSVHNSRTAVHIVP